MPAVSGDLVVLNVDEVFPPTICFAHVDLVSFAIRWSHRHFISLYTVLSVKETDGDHDEEDAISQGRHSSGQSLGRHSSTDSRASVARLSAAKLQLSKHSDELVRKLEADQINTQVAESHMHTEPLHPGTLRLSFSDACGVRRDLELRMPTERVAAWTTSLQTLLKESPRFGLPAHWRWAMACMRATSSRGKTGVVLQSEMRRLLRCANARVKTSTLNDALLKREENAEMLGLSKWQTTVPKDSRSMHNDTLSVPQVTMLLMHLCTSVPEIQGLFERNAANGRIRRGSWRRIVCDQERAGSGDRSEAADAEDELAAPQSEQLNLLQFSLHILSPQNDAVAASRRGRTSAGEPLAHYWAASSHKYPS